MGTLEEGNAERTEEESRKGHVEGVRTAVGRNGAHLLLLQQLRVVSSRDGGPVLTFFFFFSFFWGGGNDDRSSESLDFSI